MAVVCVASCNLNQWALDFDGNLRRIETSIRAAKARGATYRNGPELEITGYGCEDHFYEQDTYAHALDSLVRLLEGDATCNCLVDIGMPIMHRGVRYNARVIMLDRRILLVRPKVFLADDGNYRESRWFTPYRHTAASLGGTASYYGLEEWSLPVGVAGVTGQSTAPFGVAILESIDGVSIAPESCEELFTPDSPHVMLSLAGCDIISNGSGSHHQLRKLHTRVDLMREATSKGGGVYMYSNQRGCDGGRLYYDGSSMIIVNGACVAQASQFSLLDVEVITANVDLDDVRSMRAASVSRSQQALLAFAGDRIPRIKFPLAMLVDCRKRTSTPALPRPVRYHTPAEEIALGPACWLWDFLRRSGAGGYLLPLSGGADSAAVAAIVGAMCHLVHEAVALERQGVKEDGSSNECLADIRRVVSDVTYTPSSPASIANRVLHTVYMGTDNSGKATRDRAQLLSSQIGAWHTFTAIDLMVKAVLAVLSTFVSGGKLPRFEMHGGSRAEDLALQNLQARLRMVLAYLCAQLLPWVRGQSGFLLVLGSANVDEALRGYMTKYDCSSADLNPIGAVSKHDLKAMLGHAAREYGYTALNDILAAPPTAELRPQGGLPADLNGWTGSVSSTSLGDAGQDGPGLEHSQLDEEDMGMTYDELAWFGRLRKIDRCGPLSMYRKLLGCGAAPWAGMMPALVSEKVKRFFTFYAINRHKMTTLTPAYHAESYSPDDNRFDLRQFLYPTKWDRAFAAIDEDVKARTAVEACEF